MLSMLIFVVIIIFLALVSSFIPIGNENSTVRRLPWVTFSIMALNALIFFVTLPVVAGQQEEIAKVGSEMVRFVGQHPELLADENVRKKLGEAGLISRSESELIERQLQQSTELQSEYEEWLRSAEAQRLREQLDQKIDAFKHVAQDSLWYNYGLAPNGNWKPHQLITSAFLHSGLIHLLGNLIFFFAVAFSLEDLWGRGIFLGFYLIGAAVAVLPSVIHPATVPSIGASGAISATMGAFLIRLPKTKIKLLCLHFWWIRFIFGKKPIVVMVPGWLYLGSYFIAQVVSWYFDKKAGHVSNVGYSIHVAGFAFGLGFAGFMKATKIEERYIHPKIEAKISFAAAPAVTQALEAMDRGDAVSAERTLRTHLAKQPGDTNALLAAIQVYQKTSNFDQLNAMYGRLIRHHVAGGDKEAALYAYDSLLSSFPDDNVAPRIAARDWIVVCDYLRESEMNREAAVEYERLVNACASDPLALRAAIYGGEAALTASDADRALRLFQKAVAMDAPEQLGVRARAGVEKCEKILAQRSHWNKKAADPKQKFAW